MTLSTGHWAGEFNRRPALTDVDSGEVWSFHDLHTQVLGWATWLSKQGIRRGDRVLWLARNRIEFFALLLACHRQGWVLPHYHTAGINLFALPLLMQGGSVRIYARFDPEAFMADIIGRQLTVLLLVPTQFRRLVHTGGFTETPWLEGCARVLATGGGPIERQLLAEWADKGAVLRSGCGMTESGPTLFFQTDAEAREAPGSVGQPMPLSDVRLVGPHGDAVADGQTGEVWVRGPAITSGYWRNESANQAAFCAGWYRSGDLALREPQTRQYRIVDRVTDMYICGGENVFPADVEQVLLQHSGVEEAAVAGEYDPTWGETGVAFIVLKAGDQTTQEDLQYFARLRLAPYKVPHRWVFLEALPKTPTGKVRRGRIQPWLRSPSPISTL